MTICLTAYSEKIHLFGSQMSYQCHMNCDELRQTANKKRKEKVNLIDPV